MFISDQFISRYIDLESKIRDLMVTSFSETCGMCTACCCRADICEESVESAFLKKLLQQQMLSADDMDERYGWLDLTGCALKYGRPSVCYAYYCDELLSRLPDDDARYVTQVLGKLILHIGMNAVNETHLTEILSDEILEKVEVEPLEQQLEEAEAAFETIQEYIHSGRLSLSDREILDHITTEEP